jgi:hypothetical protein
MSGPNDDYREVARIRAVQESEMAVENNHQKLVKLGVFNIVKVTAYQTDRVGGYITQITEISGKTAEEIVEALGLKPGQLSSGAFIYRLQRVPRKNEFWPRGYSHLVDGALNKEIDGYFPGQSAWQVTLKDGVRIPAIQLARIHGDQTFDPGVHPETARLYPVGHPMRDRVRK